MFAARECNCFQRRKVYAKKNVYDMALEQLHCSSIEWPMKQEAASFEISISLRPIRLALRLANRRFVWFLTMVLHLDL